MTEKQKHIVTTALHLFYRKGVHAVGINEILAEAGVAKRTLYNYFETKEELIAATLAYRDATFIEWLKGRLDTVSKGKEALLELFVALDDWFNNRCEPLARFRGCFFINVAAEYGDPESPIFQAAKEHKRRVRALVQAHVAELGRSAEESRQLVDTITLLKEGAIVTAMVQEDSAAARKLLPVVECLLQVSACR
ncbi:TetR/AcrR family transcriptional regulator [Oleidesulfovibrio sp.]|uniref:TetR/AcrR family transcriptional regulator n=1 Tax=Oleidesulfovibrio sp. TaxID=2909707 RepID=UPI003A8C7A59